MRGILELLKTTTRLPMLEIGDIENEKIGKSMKFYPLIGIIIGAIMYGCFYLVSMKINSEILIAILMVVIYIILTGAIQLSGLATTFGSVFRFRSKQKMKEGMKEGINGTNGILALVLYVLLSVVLLSETEKSIGISMGSLILLYPVIGRMNSVISCAVSESTKSSGTVKYYIESTTMLDFLFSFLLTLAYTFVVMLKFEINLTFLVIIPIVAILGYLFSKLISKKIGSATEDTLGAIVELSQISLLLLAYFIM